MPEYTLSPPVGESDRTGIVDIFNHYVEHTFAAYPEEKVPYAFFDMILGIARTYPVVTVRDAAGEVAGFGMLRPHNPMPAFARTAEITCFLRPDLSGRGGSGRRCSATWRPGGEKARDRLHPCEHLLAKRGEHPVPPAARVRRVRKVPQRRVQTRGSLRRRLDAEVPLKSGSCDDRRGVDEQRCVHERERPHRRLRALPPEDEVVCSAEEDESHGEPGERYRPEREAEDERHTRVDGREAENPGDRAFMP